MHDTYRRNFNGIDLFNRDCFGKHSLQKAIATRGWERRMFLAIFGLCETNAMKAYRSTVGPITRFKWLVELSNKLIHNPYIPADAATMDDDDAAAG